MIVEPKTKGFICTTAHPVGCEKNVEKQIAYAKENAILNKQGALKDIKNVLVIGCSTGYGLASRIAASFSCGLNTLGVMFERDAAGKRTASPGFYNIRAFERGAKLEGLYAGTINGDAFSDEIKRATIEKIRNDLGKIDLVIYSLASPRRNYNGTTYNSVLKTIEKPFSTKSLNLGNNEIETVSLEPATKEEIENTIKVMGGEDWSLWINALKEANVLSEQAITLSYSYLGPELTYPIYQSGTIGQAKKDLEITAKAIMEKNEELQAYVCVNKAVVTQSSAAIPGVPLYLSAMYSVMKEMGLHEGCIEQMVRLFKERLNVDIIPVDDKNRIRMDDLELRPDVQEKIMNKWEIITTENVKSICDIAGYWDDFYQMFGFHMDGVDYTKDVEV